MDTWVASILVKHDKGAMNIFIYVLRSFLKAICFYLFGGNFLKQNYWTIGICLVLYRSDKLFSKEIVPFYVSTNSWSLSRSEFDALLPFNFSQLNSVVSPCGVNFHFPDD